MKRWILLLSLMAGFSARAQSSEWVVQSTEWTAQDEQNYASFVQALGRSKCNNVNDCIRNPANPYYGTDPEGVRFYSDCADFPYFLRAYFAWKNNLPFGYVADIASYDAIERRNNPPVLQPGEVLKPINIRYTDLGNYPTARRSLIPKKGASSGLNFFTEMDRLQNSVSSGTLRIGPEYDGKIAQDFYSPALQPGSIRPGTTIYDPNGHVAVVYEVLPDGRVLCFDAHPDNSVTQCMFTARFARSRPAQGAGFKNFRPLKLVGAQRSAWGGGYTGGSLVYAKNSEIPDFAETQYFGTNPDPADWRKGTFVFNNKTVTFHEYVRLAIATEKINPVNELLAGLQELCNNFKDRSEAVIAALDNGIQNKEHPPTLPMNIFGASGDWENYSTPGRDARLRTSFLDLQKSVSERYGEWLKDDFSNMKYEGTDLKKDLLRAFHKVNMECPVSYKNSAGKTMQLGFEIAIRRLFKLSFDPYHCVELRWGASHPDELKTCADNAAKRRWYNAEQSIRNNLARDWQAPSDITPEMLENGSIGVAATPDIDLRKFLMALPAKGGQ